MTCEIFAAISLGSPRLALPGNTSTASLPLLMGFRSRHIEESAEQVYSPSFVPSVSRGGFPSSLQSPTKKSWFAWLASAMQATAGNTLPTMKFKALAGDPVEPRFRVPHSFAHFAKGWGIARSATAVAFLFVATSAISQSTACDIASITSGKPLEYPPIARLAHISGMVIVKTRFASSGKLTNAMILSGPEMLRASALSFASRLQVNPWDGYRECPIVITYRIQGETSCVLLLPATIETVDVQHFTAIGSPVQTCDPTTTVSRIQHHFLFFHWYSKPL